MTLRFSKTEKWRDAWFSDLPLDAKLLFLYLVDNCDVAGFIEYTPRIWSAETGLAENELTDAMSHMSKKVSLSTCGEVVFINSFIRNQKNLPLNPGNNAHKGIIMRLFNYKKRFDGPVITEYLNKISAPGEPLPRGTGKGSGKGSGLGEGHGEDSGQSGEVKTAENEIGGFDSNHSWLQDLKSIEEESPGSSTQR